MPGRTTVVVGAAILRNGRVLAARRVAKTEVAGGWEFPGGKVEPGETPEEAVVREVREELGCDVAVTGMLPGEVPIKAGYVLRVALARLVSRLVSGDPGPVPHEHDAIRWLAPEELYDIRWLDADRPFLPALRDLLLDGDRLPEQ